MDEREKNTPELRPEMAAAEPDSGVGLSEQDTESDLSLEASFEKLDGLLERLEDREIPLEEAFTLYQQGVELIRRCNEKIDTVDKKILVMTGDGGFDEF
ncbi:MAG: exodeoxyribonuclease VII small subunit [Clostridiales bacterium]|nr:exodeoxyribonuclease VII small subunit [Clostridiales bacterium]